MPAIDWTNPSIHLLLAAIGALLVLLGLLFYFLPAARLKTLAIVVGIAGGVAAGTSLGMHLIPASPAADHGKADQGPPAPAPTTQEMLDRFRKATPTERMTMLARLPDSAATWHKVERGDVVLSIVERGVLEPADSADVVCKVHAKRTDTKVASTTKWVIDDGTQVKKGDLLIELDDSALQDQLQAQKSTVAKAKAELTQTQKDAEIDGEQAELDIKLAKHQVVLAERELRAYKGDDGDDKRGLELRLEQARHTLKSREVQAVTKKALMEARSLTARGIFEGETARLKELETDLAACKMHAPRDGLVIYRVSDPPRFGAQPSIIAPGEPVREGQKLMSIPDLSKMQVSTRIPEAVVSRAHPGQIAIVGIDALPAKPIAGKISRIANVPVQQDFLSADVKVYPALVTLTGETPGLKPGMAAEVHMVLEHRPNVLRVPVQAVLGRGRDTACYVQSGEEIQERPVIAGLNDNVFVEIRGGLKEGDRVLRDPRALAKQLGDAADKGAPPQAKATDAAQVVVRSVKPAEDAEGVRRSRVTAYGITSQDQKRIAALPGVARLVPRRIISLEARYRERMHRARAVATTSAYQEANTLELGAGRFLTEEDETRVANVVVLGSAVAAALFPREQALGQNVRVDRYYYQVVGILKERRPAKTGPKAERFDDDIYLPLPACRARFGEIVTVRQAGSFTREQVYLHQLTLLVVARDKARPTAGAVRSLLEMSHRAKDWDVRVASAP